ncbi:ATP-binding protein [Aurantibacter sp.]|uniref:sensor histidine kinase n=1 Tax=Aurantibacter sp. TaxID=2807103 RepID=UPI0032664DBA
MSIKKSFFQRSLVVGISVLIILLGLLVLFGWYTKTIELIQVVPVFVPMQYNTALCFLLSGISLYLILKKKNSFAILSLLPIGIIGFLTILEYTMVKNFGIDELFMKHYITVASTHAGRMAPNTALCFVLSSIAMGLTFGKNVRQNQISCILGALIFGLGLISIIGYLIGKEVTYGGGQLTQMAVHTTIGFMLLGAGITALNFSKERKVIGRDIVMQNAGFIGYAFALALVIFFIDLSIPIEVAIGIPYVLFVLFGWFIKKEGITTILAICSTVLIIAGFLYSFSEIKTSVIIVNRIFAIMAVWLVAGMLKHIKKNEAIIIEKNETILDITNQKLDQKIAELEIKNKELAQITYIVSHDLQEPLNTISSFTQLLQKEFKGKLDEGPSTYLSFVSEASIRMRNLIKDVLDHSRIGLKKEVEEIDLNTVLVDLQKDLHSTIDKTEAVLNIDPLPKIKGYGMDIKLLFQNLITNAIKFKKPEVKPQIKISAEESSDHYSFSIQDNGIGIAEEHQNKIFSIFQRLHSNKEYEGTGIGLAHCKKIVELHQGTINVSSIPNQGSNFIFTIKKN